MPDSQSERKDRNAALILRSIAFCLGALGGGLVGGLIVAQFAGAFFGNVANLWLYCVAGGALFGGISTCLKASKQIRRQEKMSAVADDLGLDYGTDIDGSDAEDDVEGHLLEMFSTSGHVSVGNMLRKTVGSAVLVVADVSQTRRSSHGSPSRSTTRTSTVAYFESPDLCWPTFTMQPEGKILGFLTSAVGLHDIDFDDYPVFSDKYYLSGHHSGPVRALFGAKLLDYFSDHHGLEVRASENRLVMLRPGEQCEAGRLDDFIHQALQIFGLLMDAIVANKGAIASATPSGDLRSQVEQMPGLMGAVLRGRIVTPEELEAFLKEPAPRRVPANIMRQRIGSGSLMLSFVGGLFAAVGSLLAVYSVFLADGPWNTARVVPLVLGTVFPLVGFPMCIFSLRYRYLNGRLLRLGRVADGMVTKVDKTSVALNNQQQYRASFEFEADGSRHRATVNVYGRQGRKAKKFVENQARVRMLYDPGRPSHVLWADSLLPAFAGPC